MASAGQTSTQVWQSTHISLSTFAFSFSMAIADAGHSLTQVSHPVHFLRSTTATNSVTPSYMFYKRQKIGFDITTGLTRLKNGIIF
jgi:vacuolar-type H+-ATPase subunit I/STV1